MTVHVLLPVHNRVAITARFAQCLAEQAYRDFHLVLIDDGSTDGTVEAVCTLLADATVLRGDGRLWWAGCLQRGYDWLRTSGRAQPDDLVVIINDDTVFGPDFLGNAVTAIEGRHRTLLLAQQFSQQSGLHLESGMHVNWSRFSFAPARTADEVNCLSTRGLFLRVRDMFEIGAFHPRLLPHYGSDYEYTMRAHRKGFKLVSSPDVRLWDNEATTGIRSTQGQTGWRLLRTVFLPRNQQSPYYWTMFVLLTCPARFWVPNIARVWCGFAKQLRAARWMPRLRAGEAR